MIPYGRQSITDEDIEAVVAVLKSDYLTQGEAVPTFEQGLADYCQAPHVIACSNGTTALHLACAALALGEQRPVVQRRLAAGEIADGQLQLALQQAALQLGRHRAEQFDLHRLVALAKAADGGGYSLQHLSIQGF